jgi:hypothetical protein
MFTIDDFLALKPGGVFRVESGPHGRSVITVERPGEPSEYILCLSPGHANQARMQLTDEGLTGYVAGAR